MASDVFWCLSAPRSFLTADYSSYSLPSGGCSRSFKLYVLKWVAWMMLVSVAVTFSPLRAETHRRSAPDYFGTVALPLRTTPLDRQWARTKDAQPTLGSVMTNVIQQARRMSDRDKIRTLNRWVNQSIRYRSDSTLRGQSDVWASPAQTLRSGGGDCEDFALLKRSLLRIAGVNPQRMFVVIVRDLAIRRDHAVLVIETSLGPVMLDNRTDELLDANIDQSYLPMFTFGESGSWTHGYARRNSTLATRSVGAPDLKYPL